MAKAAVARTPRPTRRSFSGLACGCEKHLQGAMCAFVPKNAQNEQIRNDAQANLWSTNSYETAGVNPRLPLPVTWRGFLDASG
jgi:hypothetical protein